MSAPLGKGSERVGQRVVWREVLRTCHLRQQRTHQLAETSIPIHQKKRASIPTVLETTKWQEVAEWQLSSTQWRINIGK